MTPFIAFMASKAGRITRIIAGIALITWGLFGLSSTTGYVVAVIGVVPLVAGLFDFCLFAPLFGAPLSGPKICVVKLPHLSKRKASHNRKRDVFQSQLSTTWC